MINQYPRTLEWQVLLAHISGRSRTWLLSHPEAQLTPEQETALAAAASQLNAGVPLPYILGHWEFYGLDFLISPEVLIPRPETELLVDTALAWLRSRPQPSYRFLDVGTGSGILPVTLATLVPGAELLATDISPAALAIARRNAEKYGLDTRISFLEADLLPETLAHGSWDILTANLPYIPSATLRELPIFGREPTLALDGGPDGLELIRRLLADITARKLAVGLILLEIETRQGPALQSLAREQFPTAVIEIKKDLAGHDRLAVIFSPDA